MSPMISTKHSANAPAASAVPSPPKSAKRSHQIRAQTASRFYAASWISCAHPPNGATETFLPLKK